MKQLGKYKNVFIMNKESEIDHDGYDMKTQIEIKCFKWLGSFQKDQFASFFNYESNHFYLREYIITKEGTIIDYFKVFTFKNEEVIQMNNSELLNQSHTFLRDNMVITSTLPNYIINYNPSAYIVCKYLNESNPLLTIMPKDEIVIGKYSMNVLHIKLENKIQSETQLEDDLLDNKEAPGIEDNEIICRICLRGGNDLSYVSVCNCKGSLKYCHPNCLLTWIENKCEITFEFINPFCYQILLKKFSCEICTSIFPIVTHTKSNEVVYLIKVLSSRESFMILDKKYFNDPQTKDNHKKEYIMLDFSNRYKKEINAGRGRNALFQLNDISVSRNHCIFYVNDGHIKIKDNGSKFGTLIKMRNDIELNKDNIIVTLQKGNSVYHCCYQII